MLSLPKTNYKKGQATLLAVLIVAAVAIVTAVGVSTRQTGSLRRTTYTSQTDQAFQCANSAVDVALLCIKNAEEAGDDRNQIIANCAEENTEVPLSDAVDAPIICSYSYDLQNLATDTVTLANLPVDTVQQFNTDGVGRITINWSRSDESTTEGKPAIEVTQAYNDGNYKLEKWAFNCGAVPSDVSIAGFSLTNPSAGVCTATFNINDGGSVTESIIRVRPYFEDAKITVSGLNSSTSQGLIINASGTAGGVRRNIQVQRMNPQLPALFDYVLYSEEGSITK